MVWADGRGRIFDAPGLGAAGRSGGRVVSISPADLVPLPPGSELFLLPGRRPVGFDRHGKAVPFGQGRQVARAVAAFLPPAYTQFLLPAFIREEGAPVLPLFAYTAVVFHRGGLAVPATRVDPDVRQDPGGFDRDRIRRGIDRLGEEHPDNRLVRHLSRCALEYCCPAARNLFQGAHEAPLPSSPGCNALCIGCISLQPSGCCPSTQERISFVPTPEELAQVALAHFRQVPDGVVSFGQGCEGEPLLEADVLREAVAMIRSAHPGGTVNLNTNGSRPERIPDLARAGLDAIRVSLSSARRDFYRRYHRPVGYDFDQVRETMGAASRAGLHVSLNYFVFPGVTDLPEEVEALVRLVRERGVRMIQWRNLNIDPDLYLQALPPLGEGMGVGRAMAQVAARVPALRHGYFNPAVPRTGTGGAPGVDRTVPPGQDPPARTKGGGADGCCA
jgi:pyruvate-formate lyase-activating enzyme